MTFSDALKIIRRYLLLIIAATIIAGAFGYFFSVRHTKMYEASVMMVVGQNQGLAENLNLTTALQDMANSMSKMISSRKVAEKTINDLNLKMSPEALLSELSAKPEQRTQLIEVTYTDKDPEQAAIVANGVGNAFSDLIKKSGESSRSGLTASVWQSASPPSSSVKPTPAKDGVLAALLGLFFGIGVAFLLAKLDTRWRSIEEIEDSLNLPILGLIPQINKDTISNTPGYQHVK